MIAASPLAAAGCCTTQYPVKSLIPASPSPPLRRILKPQPRLGPPQHPWRVVDVHGHFFNASDLPVRGFVAECFGHVYPDPIRKLIESFAFVADFAALVAPTAAAELASLQGLVAATANLPEEEMRRAVRNWMAKELRESAGRLKRTIQGTAFEQRYLALTRPAATRKSASLSETDILDVSARRSQSVQARTSALPDRQAVKEAAEAFLDFLRCMLSKRALNLQTYIDVFWGENAFGIDCVLSSLVDFDYWLDCPPRSSHADQIKLHGYLSRLSDGYLRPLVAYNPWTDIEESGAGLTRVEKALTDPAFVGVKIYPPTGFRPAGNKSHPEPQKRHPDPEKLDAALLMFFKTCAANAFPVLAHTEHTNGRDAYHDEFGGPDGWKTLLDEFKTAHMTPPTIDFAHFGDQSWRRWTLRLAKVMKDYDAPLYGDLGYWSKLMCIDGDHELCCDTRARLKEALDVPIGSSESVADRVMFGTDWFMLAQVEGWRDYPALLLRSVEAIGHGHNAAKIFGGNAEKCFPRVTQPV